MKYKYVSVEIHTMPFVLQISIILKLMKTTVLLVSSAKSTFLEKFKKFYVIHKCICLDSNKISN
jgi:hypothetical protein